MKAAELSAHLIECALKQVQALFRLGGISGLVTLLS
jgi:hypothetical protein